MSEGSPPQKILGLKDIILITIISNFGIRWLAVAAGIGPFSLVLWFLGALLFFLPLAIITAFMARLYPDAGGVYAWTKRHLGEQSGFIVAWLYVINNIFYIPAVFIFLAINFAYFLGKPELAHNHIYVTLIVLVAFWSVVVISIFGLKANKFLINYGGTLGTLVPTGILILLGVTAFIVFKGSATDFSLQNFLPHHGTFNNLATLTIMMFAMAGVEIIPVFANSVKNPRRDLFVGLLVGAGVIFLLYTIGTVAMNILLKPSEIGIASGLMNTFAVIDAKFHMIWLTRTIAFLLTFSELAGVCVWLVAPIIMFYQCTPKGLLPDYFHKTNKYQAPYVPLLFSGVLMSIIIIVSNLLTNINNMYEVLVLMATVLYFIPYLFLVVVFIKSRHELPINNFLVYVLGFSVFISVTLGIIFSFPPPANLQSTSQIVIYEAELIFGPLLFLFAGWFIFQVRKNKIQLE